MELASYETMTAILRYSRDVGEIGKDSKNLGKCSHIGIVSQIMKLHDFEVVNGFKGDDRSFF